MQVPAVATVDKKLADTATDKATDGKTSVAASRRVARETVAAVTTQRMGTRRGPTHSAVDEHTPAAPTNHVVSCGTQIDVAQRLLPAAVPVAAARATNVATLASAVLEVRGHHCRHAWRGLRTVYGRTAMIHTSLVGTRWHVACSRRPARST